MKKKEKKPGIFSNLSYQWKRLQNADATTLAAYRNLLFVLVVADLFGLYWYLGQKKIGIALLIVMIVFLALVLIAERRQNDEFMDSLKTKMTEEEKKEETEEKPKKKKEDEEEEKSILPNMGFDVDAYQDNLDKTLKEQI